MKTLLGELLVATSLLTATLKFAGDITVQLQGDGPMSLAVINGNNQQQMRGVARVQGDVPENADLKTLVGNGYLVITISPEEIYHPFGSQAEGSKSSTRQLPNVFARGLVRATVKDAKNKVFIAWKFFNIQLEAGQRGDADGNGQVETKDVQALVDFLVESIKLPSPENANANKDEDVNIDDLLYIINLMVGD